MTHLNLIKTIAEDHGFTTDIQDDRLIVSLSNRSVSTMELIMIDDLGDLVDQNLIEIHCINGVGYICVL